MAKIKENELEAINELVAKMNEIQQAIGRIEVDKCNLTSAHNKLSESLNEQKTALEEEYGPINVNLTTGEYEKIKE